VQHRVDVLRQEPLAPEEYMVLSLPYEEDPL